jgi:hypothetical protein
MNGTQTGPPERGRAHDGSRTQERNFSMSYLAISTPLVLPRTALEGLAFAILEFPTFRGRDIVSAARGYPTAVTSSSLTEIIHFDFCGNSIAVSTAEPASSELPSALIPRATKRVMGASPPAMLTHKPASRIAVALPRMVGFMVGSSTGRASCHLAIDFNLCAQYDHDSFHRRSAVHSQSKWNASSISAHHSHSFRVASGSCRVL